MDGIGFGIEKIWFRKKYRIRYRKNLVSKKVSDSVSENFWYGIKVSDSVSEIFGIEKKYRIRNRKKLSKKSWFCLFGIKKKSIGFGIGKKLVSKKVSDSVSEKIGIEKVSDLVSEIIWYRKTEKTLPRPTAQGTACQG